MMRMIILVSLLGLTLPAYGQRVGGIESGPSVLEKLYPKAQRFDLGLSAGGLINQPFVQSTVFGVDASYHLSETWGIGMTLLRAYNQDRDTRACIETFYNDPREEVAAPCLARDPDLAIRDAEQANIGPAYMPIRELQWIGTFDLQWTPFYGKHLLLQSFTGRFDFSLVGGAGAAQYLYYPSLTHIRDNPDLASRGTFIEGESQPGVEYGSADSRGLLYGKEGRPQAQERIAPVMKLGVMTSYYFLKHCQLKLTLENHLLLESQTGLQNLLGLRAGFGIGI